MSLVDYTYFEGVINIDTSKHAVRDEINLFCEEFEPIYLRTLMGSQMYYDFVANITDAKYVDLIDNDIVFNYDLITERYTGLRNMLKYFIYYQYVKSQSGFNTSLGQSIAESNNSKPITPNRELLRAYNLGVEKFNTASRYIESKGSEYPLHILHRMHKLPTL